VPVNVRGILLAARRLELRMLQMGMRRNTTLCRDLAMARPAMADGPRLSGRLAGPRIVGDFVGSLGYFRYHSMLFGTQSATVVTPCAPMVWTLLSVTEAYRQKWPLNGSSQSATLRPSVLTRVIKTLVERLPRLRHQSQTADRFNDATVLPTPRMTDAMLRTR
jgi:hypothetical protein